VKIRAAVLREVGLPPPYVTSAPLVLEEIELIPPGRDEVLIRIAAAGICHSDLSVIDGNRIRPVPMVLGHEAAAIVEEVGEGVTDLRKGDHVVTVFVASCGCCAPCATGRPALCEPAASANGAGTLLSGSVRLRSRGVPVNHHLGVSAFAEYATVSRRSLVKIDSELSLEHGALFGCAVLTGVGAVANCDAVRPGVTMAVVGLGGVGMAGILGAIAAGASRVIGIDLSGEKLDFARRLGATDVFNAGDNGCAEKIVEATQGGVDVALEAAGSVHALDLAYRITRRGGTTVTVGLPSPSAKWSMNALSLVAEERTLKGSYIGTSVPVRDIPRYVSLFKQGRLPVDKLLTHRLNFSEINQGMDRLHDGTAVRQVIIF